MYDWNELLDMLRKFIKEVVRTIPVFYGFRVFYYHFLIRCFTFQTSVISQRINASSNVSTLGSNLKSSCTELLDALVKRNTLAEVQNEFMMKILDKQTQQNDTIVKLLEQRHRGPSNDPKPSANNYVANKSDLDEAFSNGDDKPDVKEYDIKNRVWVSN